MRRTAVLQKNLPRIRLCLVSVHSTRNPQSGYARQGAKSSFAPENSFSLQASSRYCKSRWNNRQRAAEPACCNPLKEILAKQPVAAFREARSRDMESFVVGCVWRLGGRHDQVSMLLTLSSSHHGLGHDITP